MTTRGPRPQPTIKKILKGNPGKRKLNDREPKPKVSTGIPRAPAFLDKVAQREWRRTAKKLHKLGLLSEIDLTAFAAYCSCYSRWLEAQAQIQKHGMLIKAQSGFPMQSPYLAISNKAMEQMMKWLVEFGMTPSGRSRVKVDKPEDKTDPLEAFLAGGGKLTAVKK